MEKESVIDRLVAACHGRSDPSCLTEVTKIVDEIESHHFRLGMVFCYVGLQNIVFEYMKTAPLSRKVADYFELRRIMRRKSRENDPKTL